MSAFLHLDCTEDLGASLRVEWAAFHAGSRHQHPRQMPQAAAQEIASGRKVSYVTGRTADGIIRATGLFALQPNRFLPNSWSDAHCRSGPICDDAETLLDFLDATARLPAFRRVGRLRVTPYWTNDEARQLQQLMLARKWHPTDPEIFQQTGWINLDRDPEAIFASFSKSARREFRRAERQEISHHHLQNEDEARQFLQSMNRIHARKGMAQIPEKSFLAEFTSFTSSSNCGTVIGAFHEGQLVAGLQIICSDTYAHTSRFTSEPELLHRLGNLRISPYVWYHGMLWAHGLGCQKLDVEGWRADAVEGDGKYNIHKYKAEFSPDPVLRIGEHSRIINPWVNLMGSSKKDLLQYAKRLRLRF